MTNTVLDIASSVAAKTKSSFKGRPEKPTTGGTKPADVLAKFLAVKKQWHLSRLIETKERAIKGLPLSLPFVINRVPASAGLSA